MGAYLRLILIGLLFFYQFGLNNILMALSGDITQVFHLSSSQLGMIAGLYFWGNIFFLLPAGWMIDRLGARRIVLLVMGLSVVLVALSAAFENVYVFSVIRFFEGICGAFGLVGALKLGTFYFSQKQLARMSGVITMLGMLGGFVMAMPVGMMVDYFDWKIALYAVALLGVVILVLIFMATQKKPTQKAAQHKGESLKESMKIFVMPVNLLSSAYICLMNLPLYLLAALWGLPMLRALTSVSGTEAALIVSMLFIGNMVGAPLYGYFSDHFKMRKVFMYLGALSSIGVLFALIQTQLACVWLDYVLFFLLGLTTSSQLFSYVVAMENNPAQLSGSVSAMIAIFSSLGGALGQPLFGVLLSWLLDQGVGRGQAYLDLSYLFIGAFVLALLGAWRLKSK